MKTEISTPLGRLIIITDQRRWMFLVAILMDLARELGVPIPRTLYYGPVEYERLLSPADFQDVHLTGRRTGDVVEYWYRDQMILVYTGQARFSEMELKGLIAHELLHHDDNLNQRNITSYALYCASTCDLDYPHVCVNYVGICVNTLRNVSVATRLPPTYRRPNLMLNLERAEEAYLDAGVLEDEAQRRLALLYCLIISTELALFDDTAERAAELRDLSLRAHPESKGTSSVLAEWFKKASERQLDQTFEEEFLADLHKVLCELMHKIFGER